LRLKGTTVASVALAVPFCVALWGADNAAEDAATLDLLNRYQDAKRTQQDALSGGKMEVNIDAKLTKLEKQGKMHLQRYISKLGHITYKMLGFSGDNTVKKEVIARYLESDTDPKLAGTAAITPANYKFKKKYVLEQDGHRTVIFHITPKKKAAGLFEGELWLDVETGMPVRESGHLVKNPSVFVKKLQFVRTYEIRNGIAYPTRIESQIDVRVVGRAEVNIEFGSFTKETVDDDVAQALIIQQ